jgi:hypothetical protein
VARYGCVAANGFSGQHNLGSHGATSIGDRTLLISGDPERTRLELIFWSKSAVARRSNNDAPAVQRTVPRECRPRRWRRPSQRSGGPQLSRPGRVAGASHPGAGERPSCVQLLATVAASRGDGRTGRPSRNGSGTRRHETGLAAAQTPSVGCGVGEPWWSGSTTGLCGANAVVRMRVPTSSRTSPQCCPGEGADPSATPPRMIPAEPCQTACERQGPSGHCSRDCMAERRNSSWLLRRQDAPGVLESPVIASARSPGGREGDPRDSGATVSDRLPAECLAPIRALGAALLVESPQYDSCLAGLGEPSRPSRSAQTRRRIASDKARVSTTLSTSVLSRRNAVDERVHSPAGSRGGADSRRAGPQFRGCLT